MPPLERYAPNISLRDAIVSGNPELVKQVVRPLSLDNLCKLVDELYDDRYLKMTTAIIECIDSAINEKYNAKWSNYELHRIREWTADELLSALKQRGLGTTEPYLDDLIKKIAPDIKTLPLRVATEIIAPYLEYPCKYTKLVAGSR